MESKLSAKELTDYMEEKYPLELQEDGKTHVISQRNLENAKRRHFIVIGWELATGEKWKS